MTEEENQDLEAKEASPKPGRRIFHFLRNLFAIFGLLACLAMSYGYIYASLFFKEGNTDYMSLAPGAEKGKPMIGLAYPPTFVQAGVPILPVFESTRVYTAAMALDNPMKRVVIFNPTDEATAKRELSAIPTWLEANATYTCKPLADEHFTNLPAGDAKPTSGLQCVRSLNEREEELAQAKTVTLTYYDFTLKGEHLLMQTMWPGDPDSKSALEEHEVMESFKWQH